MEFFDLIDGLFYPLNLDYRFPLQLSADWQKLSDKIDQPPDGTYIYVLLCNNKYYIGSSLSKERLSKHKYLLRNNSHPNKYLQSIYKKYGIENIYYQYLVTIPKSLEIFRCSIENAYIKHFDTYANGYNLCQFCDAPFKGRKHRPETKKKIGESSKGRVHSNETKRKIGLGNSGKKKTKAEIEKFISSRARAYLFLNPDNKIVKIFNLRQFCKENSLSYSCMNGVFHSKEGRTQHKGWRKYK